jgi:hypothetical protein
MTTRRGAGIHPMTSKVDTTGGLTGTKVQGFLFASLSNPEVGLDSSTTQTTVTKLIRSGDLTEQEKSALEILLKNIVNTAEFRKRAAAQETSIEAMLQRRRNEMPAQRNARARQWIDIVDSGNRVGILHEPELFFLRVSTVEWVHHDRFVDGAYEAALADIQSRMERVRTRHNLSDDEFWPLGDGPPEWELLNREYDAISDRLFVATLREFGLLEEAQLREKEPQEFDRRRELGRRAMHNELPDVERLELLQVQFEREASASAAVGAFHAAATMMGAAIEAALLACCLRRLDEVRRARARLPEKQRPRKGNPRTWTFEQLTRVAAEASWLPEFHACDGVLPSEILIDMVRELRNMVHPAVHLRSTLTNRVVRTKYEDAQAIYDLLRRHLTI